MKITIRSGNVSLEVNCDGYNITPTYCNIWIKSFPTLVKILEHRVCESLRVLVMNHNYDVWQLGFRTEDIKFDI